MLTHGGSVDLCGLRVGRPALTDRIQHEKSKLIAGCEFPAPIWRGAAQLAQAQKHTDRRMDALIVTVDEIIRKRE